MVAVTGANGLLGSHLVRKLHEENIPFVALKREKSDITLLNDINDKITWRNMDLADPATISEALQDVTHVIHAAALVSFNPRDEKKLYRINVEGTKNLVDVCLDLKIPRLLHVSSVASLGRQKSSTVITEKQKWVNSPINSFYAVSKYQAELEIFRGQEEGVSTVTVNPSLILGPGKWSRSSAQIIKYVADKKMFYTEGSANYVDVRDVCDAIIKLLYSQYEGERFIISAGNITYQSLFKKIAFYLNTRAPFVKLNRPLLKVIVFLEKIRSIITAQEPLITPETARAAGHSFFYDNEKIKNALNFEFRSIEDTLKWCCEHYPSQVSAKK